MKKEKVLFFFFFCRPFKASSTLKRIHAVTVTYLNLNIYLINHVGLFNVCRPSSFRNSNCHLSTVNGLRGPQSDCPQCAVVGPPAFRHPEVWESQLITLLCGLWSRLGLLWFPFSGVFLFWFLLLLLFFISFPLKAIFKWMCQLSWTSEIRTSF